MHKCRDIGTDKRSSKNRVGRRISVNQSFKGPHLICKFHNAPMLAHYSILIGVVAFGPFEVAAFSNWEISFHRYYLSCFGLQVLIPMWIWMLRRF